MKGLFFAMQSFLTQVSEFIRSHRLIKPGQRILIAVSGGKDSMALLHALIYLRKAWSLSLCVVHIHHGIRDEEADRDERFVMDSARAFNLPFYSIRVDVPCVARETGCSLEETARNLRRAAIMGILHRIGFDLVALGHQADDQSETILLHLMRGSGIRGLGGMTPMRGCFIRPLLFVLRQEIDAFVADTGIPYREDSSNQDRRFLRNRLRLDILPSIRDAFGNTVTHRINRAGQAAGEVDTYIRAETEDAWEHVAIRETSREITLEIDSFLSYFKIIQKSMAALAIEKLTGFSSFLTTEGYERVLRLAEKGKSGAQVLLDQKARVIRSGGNLVFMTSIPALKEYRVGKNSEIRIPELGLTLRVTESDPGIPEDLKRHDRYTEYADDDKIKVPITVRSCRAGDSFIPLGMKGRKKIHDFFIDEKIPIYRRRVVPLLCSGKDIVWVGGYRMDDRFKVTAWTKRVLKIELLHDPLSG